MARVAFNFHWSRSELRATPWPEMVAWYWEISDILEAQAEAQRKMMEG